MKQSLRAKRMAKHHKRTGGQSKLNLVSLMDIFTILVFFLLINSDDVEVLQNNDAIELPESVSEQKPDTTLVIMASNEDLLVNGRSLAKVEDILASDDLEIQVLADELIYLAERAGALTELEEDKGRAVTIMGDSTIPYALLKRIMSTCAANEYRDISMAVSQVAASDPIAQDGTDLGTTANGQGEG